MKLLDYEVLRQYVSNNNADNLFSTIPTTNCARINSLCARGVVRAQMLLIIPFLFLKQL